MAVLQLSAATSFNPGADLWVTAQPEISRNTQRMDWYINFQISKAFAHQARGLPKPLSNIISACELEPDTFRSSPEQGLLVLATQLLPAKWIYVLPLQSDLAAWTQQIFKTWQDLQTPSLRVFLPAQRPTSDFQSFWSQLSNYDSYGVVSDTAL